MTREKRSVLAAAAALGLLLVWVLPMLLRQPITLDTMIFEVFTDMVRRGRVLYRDIFQTNFPGANWIHLTLHALAGRGAGVIRVFDLAVQAGIIALLLGWVARAGRSTAALLLMAVVLAAFYSGRSEWCQCQRDTWMLLPALAALALRRSQVARLRGGGSAGRIAAASLAEGLLWGAAFWIKPFVAVPAAVAWLTTAYLVARPPAAASAAARRLALDLAAVVLGGLLAAAPGIAWLQATGSWPAFLDTMLSSNQEYYARVTWLFKLQRWAGMFERFFPWALALPLACAVALVRLGQAGHDAPDGPLRGPRSQALLGAFLLGWIAQALVIQRPFDYVFVPAVLVALAFLGGEPLPPRLRIACRGVLAVLAVVALAMHPLLQPERLKQWPRCWRPGRDPELMQTLAVERDLVSWRSLDRVADYLRGRAGDNELVCFNESAMPLYHDLAILPPTRWVYPAGTLAIYRKLAPAVLQELNASPQKYVVTDLAAMGLTPEEVAALPPEGEVPAPQPSLAWKYPRYPWSLPVVFRAGRYAVHRVEPPAAPDPPRAGPDGESARP